VKQAAGSTFPLLQSDPVKPVGTNDSRRAAAPVTGGRVRRRMGASRPRSYVVIRQDATITTDSSPGSPATERVSGRFCDRSLPGPAEPRSARGAAQTDSM